jgi:RimJ/RimL family protein N-acetyltransferase
MINETKAPFAPFLYFPGGYLCPIEPSDAPLIYTGWNDPTQRHLFDRVEPKQLRQQVEWIEGLGKQDNDAQVFKMVLTDGPTIGTMGIHNIDYKNRTATTGSMMFDTNYWGKQYGRKAKIVLLNHAFNQLNLELIESFVIEFNERSLRYCLACGYMYDGFLPGRHLIEGKRYGRHALSITRTTFEPIWEKFRKEHQIETFAEMIERTMLSRPKS